MRDENTHYGYADTVNRRARIGVLLVAVLVVGVAWAASAIGSNDTPPPTVLSAEITLAPLDAAVEVTASPTTIPDRSTTTLGSSSTTAATTTTTVAPPSSTTSTTRPSTTSTTRRTTTTTRPPTTTTTLSTTTTTLPPTTTSTTSTTTTTTTTTTVPPTTTTTLPPTTTTTTTTTTIVPVLGTIHIHDLKGDDKEDDRGPYAKVEVFVRKDNNKALKGVRVTGMFIGLPQGAVAGVTNNSGKVVFESGPVDEDSVTFRVTGLTHPDYVYDPDDNRRGPSITIELD